MVNNFNLNTTSKSQEEIQIEETSLINVNKVKLLGIHIAGDQTLIITLANFVKGQAKNCMPEFMSI